MRKILQIGLLSFILFLTACSVDYELLVTNDKQFIEKITIKAPRQEFATNDAVARREINDIISSLREEDGGYRQYFYDYRLGNSVVTVRGEATHSSFRVFQNSALQKNVFERINLTEGNTYKIETSGLLLYDPDLGVMAPEWEDNLTVKMRFHNRVASTNADEENFITNTFVWNFNSNEPDKEIVVELEYGSRYDVIFGDFLRNYGLVILVFLIMVAAGGFTYLYYLKSSQIRNRI